MPPPREICYLLAPLLSGQMRDQGRQTDIMWISVRVPQLR